MVLLLVLATLLVYEPSLRNAFLNYDDPDYVTQNYYVLQGLSWHNLAWAFTTTAEANWHPLTWISHMADVQFFGLHATGHHLVNLLLHTLNVVLLFLLLRFATGNIFSSAAVAALFALLPAQCGNGGMDRRAQVASVHGVLSAVAVPLTAGTRAVRGSPDTWRLLCSSRWG